MGGVQKKNQRSQEIPAWHRRVIRALITLLLIFYPSLPSSFAMDSITSTQSIKDANTKLLSPDENFALGFFIPPNSTNSYIGIWYNKIPERKVVWVANRQNPLTNSSGVFTINSNGDLVLLDKHNNTVWFALNATTHIRNSRAKLSDTGNLVLSEQYGEERLLWQSFEHPSDTFLSTMKLGESRRLRSWKSLSDPSIGSFSAGVNVAGNLKQTFIWHNSTPHWRSGPWNGRTFTGISSTDSEYFNGFQLVRGGMEGNASGGTYEYFRDSFDSRFELGPSGKLQQVRWDEEKNKYHAVWSEPQGECDLYGKCGPFGVGNQLTTPICRCLPGFRPKAIEEWSIGNWSGKRAKVSSIVLAIMFLVILIADVWAYYYWLNRAKQNGKQRRGRIMSLLGFLPCIKASNESIDATMLEDGMNQEKGAELFDFTIIETATDKFSNANMLGQGGFGPVYKGKLPEGQEIAVKRLSRSSGQGILEFKNEVIVILKLQHRNLVKLLGCCITRKEKMLVYEYMPNKSLDAFLFDLSEKEKLDWATRFNIIEGIARGLLYLHRDSRLMIIHGDLKAGNILLDTEMNPKISDFGMARIFGRNQTLETTNKVVGTFGYMSPEYAMAGQFSVKSDVFSFGVLLLEIVTGIRNAGFSHHEQYPNLPAYAWKLWNEDRGLELIDLALGGSYIQAEVFRCIHIGLLCVQDVPSDRPHMQSIVLMLVNETTTIPIPKKPAFIDKGSPSNTDSPPGHSVYSINYASITTCDGR